MTVLKAFNFSGNGDLQLTETSDQNWQKMGTKGSRSFRNGVRCIMSHPVNDCDAPILVHHSQLPT